MELVIVGVHSDSGMASSNSCSNPFNHGLRPFHFKSVEHQDLGPSWLLELHSHTKGVTMS